MHRTLLNNQNAEPHSHRPGSLFARYAFSLLLLSPLLLSACQSPKEFYTEADDVANELIDAKQKEVLGHEQPFTIETPVDTFRRKIIAAQGITTSGKASIGVDYLKKSKLWPKDAPHPKTNEELNRLTPWEATTVKLSLLDALQIAARNNRGYQSQKERVYQAALNLDLEDDAFRTSFFGTLDTILSTDLGAGTPTAGVETTGRVSATKRFRDSGSLTMNLGFDLAKLITMDRESAFGFFADATITVPLMRGSGRHIAMEGLIQAERDLMYALHDFERFKRTFAVRIASDYLSVLQQNDQVRNAAENYRRLISSGNRARRMNQAGRLSEIQVAQATQDELRARDGWIRATENYKRSLDAFKISLGLPTDAAIELNQSELDKLAEDAKDILEKVVKGPNQQATREIGAADDKIELPPVTNEAAGPYELPEEQAIQLAFENRLDLRTTHGVVFDAQRNVIIAADALRMGLDVTGSAAAGERRSLGSASLDNGEIRPERGNYSVGLAMDLPWERTAERNSYRNAYIQLERTLRDVQELEDQIKFDLRDTLRRLRQTRESLLIQATAVELAKRRVESTNLFLRAGEAQIRDLLEAQEDLLDAQDALTAALVQYRISELELQRDMGVLNVNEKGLWQEYKVNPNGQP